MLVPEGGGTGDGPGCGPGVPASMASTEVFIPHLKKAELEETCTFLMFPAAPALSCPHKAPGPPQAPPATAQSPSEGQCGCGTWAPKMLLSHASLPPQLELPRDPRAATTFPAQFPHSHRVPGSFLGFLLPAQGGATAQHWRPWHSAVPGAAQLPPHPTPSHQGTGSLFHGFALLKALPAPSLTHLLHLGCTSWPRVCLLCCLELHLHCF